MALLNSLPFITLEQAEQFWQKETAEVDVGSAVSLQNVAQQFSMDWFDLHQPVLADLEVIQHIPEHYAKTHKLLPIDLEKGVAVFLVATPFLGSVAHELATTLTCPVKFMLTQAQLLTELIDQVYSEKGTNSILSEFSDESFEELENIEDLKDMAQAAPIIKLVNSIFMEAIGDKASDIHVSPYQNGLDVRYRIDGILQVATTVPRKFQAAIISRIKIMADLDIAERRLPQDGRIKLKSAGRDYDIRVATTPTVFGEGAVLRILDKSSIQVAISEVGFDDDNLVKWLGLLSRTNQVVLVTGPTGSGKTTTLYASLNHIKSTELKLISIEDPVEYQLEGIDQIQVNSRIDMTFAKALRSILRQDPDVIMVGEIRDGETAEIAIQSALTGHLVLSTLHTNDAASSITRLIDMGVEPYLISSSVAGVLAQRLVRKLCDCKQKDKDGGYLAVGCELCKNSGYKGRLGLFELLILSPEINELINSNASSEAIAKQAQKEGMQTLVIDGMQKVKQGLTTEAEVRRVASE